MTTTKARKPSTGTVHIVHDATDANRGYTFCGKFAARLEAVGNESAVTCRKCATSLWNR